MKRVFMLFFSCILILSSCTLEEVRLFNYSENPFLDETNIYREDCDTLKISVITDSHYYRDNDGECRWFDEEYLEFLEGKDYEFIINLGDISDSGLIDDAIIEKCERMKEKTERKTLLVVRGNHDRHISSPIWDEEESDFQSASHFYYGLRNNRPIISIYNLDTSTKTIGKKQFRALTEALEGDRAYYKMIVTHENVTTGNNISPSLIMFGLSSRECNKLYKIMNDYNISLVLTGHNHIGEVSYSLNEGITEINLSAFHRRVTKPVQYESMGTWYDLTIDFNLSKGTLTGYNAEDGEEKSVYNFTLRKSD